VYKKGIKSFTTNGSCKNRTSVIVKRNRNSLVSLRVSVQNSGVGSMKPLGDQRTNAATARRVEQERTEKVATFYKKATWDYAKAINATSTQINGEIGKVSDGGYGYDPHDLNALEMAKGIRSAFTAPKRQASADSATSQRISANMMKQIALRVKDVKNA